MPAQKFKNIEPITQTSLNSYEDLKSKIASHKTKSYEALNQKMLQLPAPIRDTSIKLLSSGVIAGLTLLGPLDNISLPNPNWLVAQVAAIQNKEPSLADLIDAGPKTFLPKDTYLLTTEKRQKLSGWVSQVYGISAKTSLDDNELPSFYGLIGAEQHLYRYPGDTTEAHMRDQDDFGMYYASGIAPLTGAWGYFASSKEALTSDLEQKERYYAVVQTFLLPDWNQNWTFLKEWYKYRKVIIVNTETYQACVADIADSGPSTWTGKVFGGSPEVMEAIGLARGPRKGPVVVLFVDDPEGKIPLGPIPYAEASKYV